MGDILYLLRQYNVTSQLVNMGSDDVAKCGEAILELQHHGVPNLAATLHHLRAAKYLETRGRRAGALNHIGRQHRSRNHAYKLFILTYHPAPHAIATAWRGVNSGAVNKQRK